MLTTRDERARKILLEFLPRDVEIIKSDQTTPEILKFYLNYWADQRHLLFQQELAEIAKAVKKQDWASYLVAKGSFPEFWANLLLSLEANS